MATVRASQRPSASEKPLHNHIPSHSLSKSLNNTPSNHHSTPPPRSSKDRPASSRRSVTPNSRTLSNNSNNNDDEDSGRVRVAVRLRPRNAEDLVLDADFADCVELQPELKRLKLRKNNWSSESYRFDEVFTETASQRRVYEVVAKPVVESVLDGYNGTIMAYGQTGTGKTYTVGRLGKEDASERGIMVRALEDIIAGTSLSSDGVEVSYLQLYMESIQDLFAPEKINIPVYEDSKTGEVSLPGATVVKVRDLDHFLELLQVGEANRHAANTKLNTESSRSHAILMVYVRRSIQENVNEITSQQKGTRTDLPGSNIPIVRKSKLLIVDLAGSERIDKSGSEGALLEEAKFINLSLTSLGKCINALAENSPHIPTRDSKLTRLLRDSFGGSAKTSLIVTIGPSARHHAETTSTIMFGQRAMKIVNMVKLKEEYDYESLCRKLETQVDQLIAEIERQQKIQENDKNELEKQLRGYCNSFDEEKKNLVTQVEDLTAEIEKQQKLRENDKYEFEKQLREYQDSYDEARKHLASRCELLEKENAQLGLGMKDFLSELNCQKDNNNLMCDKVSQLETSLKNSKKVLVDTTQMYEKKISELMKQIDIECIRSESAEEQLDIMKKLVNDHEKTIKMYETKIAELIKQLDIECTCSESAEEQLSVMKKGMNDHQRSMKQYEVENSMYQKALADTTQLYEKKIAELNKKVEDEHTRLEVVQEELDLTKKLLNDYENSVQEQNEINELRVKLQEMYQLHESTVNELQSLKSEFKNLLDEKERMSEEIQGARQRLLVEEKQRKALEYELVKPKKTAPENEDDFEDKKPYVKDYVGKGSPGAVTSMGLRRSNQSRDVQSGQRATIAKICDEVGLPKIVQLLTSEDPDVQIHAVKVVANLAAEDINQEKIVEEGGLDALLSLLQSSQNPTILRVASGAIANLAMNEMNQGLIMSRGGARLLAKTAARTDDPQTLRMVAGALGNLCGNEKLHVMLKEDGAIKTLLEMVKSGNGDVIAQIARGLANFAKCESRGIFHGYRKGRSLLMDEGALQWLISSCTISSASTRRHVELALCHLAQNEDNTRDFITSGGAKELVRISVESSREDICNLAKKTLKLNPKLQAD
ncbi:kinesin-like protein KIN-UC isoform X2 [Mangifera indica]|uniref:kinesin-like protein KIN-UC isoform X2 n=1 Tax=Mangifera indica TaxID=29780 RepID=UPI001CF97FB2|nr:kinesin-like protein KIN-UC isoform X2 [Mangifera indica]